jgi:hypothetical protein
MLNRIPADKDDQARTFSDLNVLVLRHLSHGNTRSFHHCASEMETCPSKFWEEGSKMDIDFLFVIFAETFFNVNIPHTLTPYP